MANDAVEDKGWQSVHLPEDHVLTEYHRVLARLVVKHTPETGRVLDIGAGLGHMLNLVRQESPSLELHAADIYEGCLDQVRANVPDATIHTITTDPVSVADLPQRDFDTCIMSHTLEHTFSPLDSLKAALSVLKPEGKLVLAVPNPVRPQVILGAALRFDYVNRGHVCCWDKSHWKNFLERIAKVDVVEYAHDDVRLAPLRLSHRLAPVRFVERNLAKVLPWMSTSNIAVVKNAA